MSEMTLSTALREAREAVDEERHEEAMLLARHVLRQHPACVWAYRLLAEAALERGERRQAEELFLRALSVDPEDYLSWFGLAMLAEGEERLDEATRWAQQAFDLEPGKPGIRELVARLKRRGEGPAERLDLSRAALARLLARGGLYEQAIQEYRAALEESPERLDLLLGLAETLWRHGRRIEAAEVCQEVLERLPNCLKAHLLLGEIWHRAGRENEARPLLARAQELDPLNAMAQELLGERSPLPPQDPVLPPLDVEREVLWKGPAEVPPSLLEVPEVPSAEAPLPWGLEEEAPAVAVEEGEAEGPVLEPLEEVPEWLKALEAEVAPGEAGPPEEGVWLQVPPAEAGEEVGVEAPPPAVEVPEAGPAAEEPLPTWLVEEEEAGAPAPPGEEVALPPWLQGMEQEREVVSEMPAAPSLEAEVEAEPVEAEGVPDWLAELRRRAAAAVEEVEEALPEEVTPAEGAPETPWAGFAEAVAEGAVPAEEAPEALAEATAPAEEVPEGPAEAAAPAEEAAEVPPAPWEHPRTVQAEAAARVEEAPEVPAEEEGTRVPGAEGAPAAAEAPPEAEEAPPARELPAEVQAALERLAVRPNDHGARLLVARAYAARGEVLEALAYYQHLVTVDDVLAQVVEDLERLAVQEPHLARVHQLLGDAFMHQGRLNEALGAYRQALQILHRPSSSPKPC
ncbi:MAG: tetratricopeptide repeat protein [Anaerolineae bacterium]